MGRRHWVVSVLRSGAGVLIVAASFALIGVVVGWRPLVIILGALVIVYVGLWWLTEQSQSKFGKEHRAWREEKAMKPVREEAQKIAEEEARKATAIFNRMFFR